MDPGKAEVAKCCFNNEVENWLKVQDKGECIIRDYVSENIPCHNLD